MRDELLQTWFAEGPEVFRPAWFRRDDAFDSLLRARFGHALLPAREGALDGWIAGPRGALALVLLLDQLPRNLFRGTAEAFASDAKARAVAREAVFVHRHHRALTPVEQVFLFLPFEHSESLADQELSVALFEGLRHDPRLGGPGGAVDYAWRHLEVIRRFGRFPHRNAALGRTSTAEEVAYLAEPGAGF
ncbi:MAG: DUF924 domain-containing protein [Acetobacteraceae bacterium]|nr:DUF924 domain-containing protein [Acetobacteraceae bacterium]